MAGLLDALNTYEGQQGLGLLAAAGPRFDGAGFFQRLQEGLGSADKWKREQSKAELEKLQLEEVKQKMLDSAQEREKKAQLLKLVEKYRTPAVTQGQLGSGPTNLVNDALPADLQIGAQKPVAPRPAGFNREGFASAYEGIDPIAGFNYQQSIKKDDAPVTVAPGGVLLSGRSSGYKPIFTNPKEDSTDPKVKQFEYAKANGYKGSFEQFVTLGPTIMAGAVAPLRNAQIQNMVDENSYNLPQPRASSGGVTVKAPNGKTYSFPSQSAANSFKMKAGIK